MADNNKNKRSIGTKQSTAYIKKMIVEEAQRQGVPVELALAVAQHESGFNNIAVSKKNTDGSRDHGVFQLNDKYHKLNNVYDPAENIRYGIGMLKNGLERNNGNVAKTLSDYNAGPNAKGKNRRAGDSYAKKVMALMPKFNQKEIQTIALSTPKEEGRLTQSEITGAAAPIGERLADVQADYINAAEQGINKYASQPYDPSLALNLRAQREKELYDMFNRIVKETPEQLSPAQEQAVLESFARANQDVLNVNKEAQERLQGMTGPRAYEPYEQKIRNAYEEQIARLQAANPYTRLAQNAPIQDLEPIDIERLKATQASDRFGTALSAMNNPAAQRPDYAALQLNQAKQLEDAAKYNQAVQNARVTGLPVEYFLAGATADYNAQLSALNAQNQALVGLYNQAMAGDRNALSQLTALAQNTQGNIVSNQSNAYTALNQARQAQLNLAKENFDRRMQMAKQIQALDPYMVQGGTQVQGQNISTAGNMYNTGINAGVDAGRNLTSYETGMLKAANDDTMKPPTVQQVVGTMGNVASQSPDPNALNNFYNAAAQVYSSAGVPNQYLLPFIQPQQQLPQQ